ncbi:unnamed protein product [Brassicogethes aeneus]|uniref:C2H2-type domain-containing protein n=1 Tax=Brassicogethes aeneus TaxID=1431903 RepID=A0A9P0FBY6_BRAAE|nr:unnamed protein product [Brassicogethes aeneus]
MNDCTIRQGRVSTSLLNIENQNKVSFKTPLTLTSTLSSLPSQEMDLIDDKSALSDLQVKQEEHSEDSANTEDNEQLYTPLTCELCNQTFTLPGDWVRHVQTHPYTLPAKRQRGDATIGDIMPDGPVTQDESAFKKRLQSNLLRHIRIVNDKILPPNNLGKTNDEG